MVCIKCGTDLHLEALQCWKCGNETPNYTEELRTLHRKAEAERVEIQWRAEHPEEVAYREGEAAYQEAINRGSKHPVLRRTLAILCFLFIAPVLYFDFTVGRDGSELVAKLTELGLPMSWFVLWSAIGFCFLIAYIVVRLIDGDLKLGDGD